MDARLRKILKLLLLCPAIADAGVLGPSNYWECILEEMQEVKNDQVAQELMKVCMNAFPEGFSVEEQLAGTSGACILEYGAEVSSALGAQQVQAACNMLYPPQ